jgi:hypothetical protein
VGVDNDTAAFAVQTLRRWWTEVGSIKYPNAERLVITADGGASNGSRVRLWKLELQRLADELGVDIEVRHFPPGTSKWNKACPREGGDRASPVLVRHDELASASFGQPAKSSSSWTPPRPRKPD